jgi:hypothetical protein
MSVRALQSELFGLIDGAVKATEHASCSTRSSSEIGHCVRLIVRESTLHVSALDGKPLACLLRLGDLLTPPAPRETDRPRHVNDPETSSQRGRRASATGDGAASQHTDSVDSDEDTVGFMASAPQRESHDRSELPSPLPLFASSAASSIPHMLDPAHTRLTMRSRALLAVRQGGNHAAGAEYEHQLLEARQRVAEWLMKRGLVAAMLQEAARLCAWKAAQHDMFLDEPRVIKVKREPDSDPGLDTAPLPSSRLSVYYSFKDPSPPPAEFLRLWGVTEAQQQAMLGMQRRPVARTPTTAEQATSDGSDDFCTTDLVPASCALSVLLFAVALPEGFSGRARRPSSSPQCAHARRTHELTSIAPPGRNGFIAKMRSVENKREIQADRRAARRWITSSSSLPDSQVVPEFLKKADLKRVGSASYTQLLSKRGSAPPSATSATLEQPSLSSLGSSSLVEPLLPSSR